MSTSDLRSKQDDEEEMLSKIGLSGALFRAPKNVGMTVLNRDAFTKSIPTVAAYVKNKRDIQAVRKAVAPFLLRDPLSRTTIEAPRLYNIDPKGQFVLPLIPINLDDETSMPESLVQLVKENKVELVPKEGTLGWDAYSAGMLAQFDLRIVRKAFTTTGHIAQLNLHHEYVHYKHVIAQTIMDKNPNVETVVLKTEDVGSASEFRTFPMEILTGRLDTDVTVRSSGCTYSFDFANVYWNTRLENEHDRVALLCKSGEAVCDVMAGVGPFAIPAAKYHRALVWANDLNKHSYESMVQNIKTNRVTNLVQPFNADGRDFIRLTSKLLLRDAGKTITYDPNPRSASRDPAARSKLKPIETFTTPGVFTRYIMNLPASAVEFLDAFIGLYAGRELDFQNPSRPRVTPGEAKKYKLPIVHVYTFNRNSHKEEEEFQRAAEEICASISGFLQYPMTLESKTSLREVYILNQRTQPQPADSFPNRTKISPQTENIRKEAAGDDMFVEGGVRIGYVRAVSPKKFMYCATFRVPREVAFRQPTKELSEEEKKYEQQKSVWLRSNDEVDWPGELKKSN
ncbi:hypothetical protein ABW20_dc0103460 [Dactylellina cionopaga]|nr:hypothetical protein ABW20_dc0103460 [Dactylellina cionopaga]